MPGDAYDTLAEFWRIQDAGDYGETAHLFADDAVFVDPIYGIFEGRAAIGEFLTRVTAIARDRGVSFRLERLSGDDHTVWAQWVADTPAGERHGVGVYEVVDGRITYYRDYMNEA